MYQSFWPKLVRDFTKKFEIFVCVTEAEWYTSSEQLHTLSISSAELSELLACARPWRNALISVRIKWNKLRAGYVCDITKHSRALKSLGRAAGPRATSLTNIKLEMSCWPPLQR